jgi:hypothetical protein
MRSLAATDRAWTISPFEIKSETAVIAPACVDAGASLVGLASDTGRIVITRNVVLLGRDGGQVRRQQQACLGQLANGR